MLALRSSDPVGHHSVAYAPISGCDVPSRETPIVIDATGEYDEDLDYIKCVNFLIFTTAISIVGVNQPINIVQYNWYLIEKI